MTEAEATAASLSNEGRGPLHQALDGGSDDADLAALARSAAAPGIKQRIRDYLARS